jgi:hypothetical protein
MAMSRAGLLSACILVIIACAQGKRSHALLRRLAAPCAAKNDAASPRCPAAMLPYNPVITSDEYLIQNAGRDACPGEPDDHAPMLGHD